jgi:hypothetical protein
LPGNHALVRTRRRKTLSLSPHEQRVLEAFYCGRLSAGRLSEALAAARRAPEVTEVRVRPQRVTAEPAPVAEPAPLTLAA